ncbi:sugar transferase [Sinomonas humi]|uniref:Polyprenyl glycosylphosphotransferase n=1 Tax=Sinomonas humi TaxID=1338436 RepID=A0A0B2AKA8_9MICC|nr:sugar transferase [Sinomonas humi]KHL02275.1 polyprenyl glycosylphosphotransferase [Sinomonas humi]
MSVGAEQNVGHTNSPWHGSRLLSVLGVGSSGTRIGPTRIARSARAQAWPRRYALCLRVADSAVVLAAVVAGVLFGGAGPRTDVALAVIAVVWPVALGVYGSRDASVFGIGAEEYRRVVAASVQLFAVLAIAALLVSDWLPARVFTLVFGTGLVGLLVARWSSRRWLNAQRRSGLYLTPAVVVGEPEDVRYVVRRITASSGAPYNVLGVVLPGGRRGQCLTVEGERLPVLSSTDDVVRTVALKKASAVIIAGPVPGGNQYVRELGWSLERYEAELVLASTLTNVAGPRIHWRPVQGLPLMEVDLPRYSGAKHVLKRGMDIVFAIVALVLLSPVLAALALVVRCDSPGPVLFRQERIGKDGTAFRMLKFRSMVVGAEAQLGSLAGANEGAGALFKVREDPRVTRCGRWMRRYSLDELPQFLNVLKGEMSLVGPRPPLAREVGEYERFTRRRMLIKPGITGLWQISGRSDLDWDDAVRLDLYYVENWSLLGDLMILWRTIRAIVDPVGAY